MRSVIFANVCAVLGLLFQIGYHLQAVASDGELPIPEIFGPPGIILRAGQIVLFFGSTVALCLPDSFRTPGSRSLIQKRCLYLGMMASLMLAALVLHGSFLIGRTVPSPTHDAFRMEIVFQITIMLATMGSLFPVPRVEPQ